MAELHVVVVPLSLYGHTLPMIQLSVQLASLGTKVSLIIASRTEERSKAALEGSLGGENDAAGIRSRVRIQILPDFDRVEELEQLGEAGMIANMVWMSSKSSEIEKLIEKSVEEQGTPASFFILDFILIHLAEKLRDVPAIPFWTPSPAYFLLLMNLRHLLDGGFLSSSDRLLSSIPGLPELCVFKDMPYCLLDRRQELTDVFFRLMQQMIEAPCVLMNTMEKLDREALRGIRSRGVKAINVGPLVSPSTYESQGGENDGGVVQFLDSKPASSVIYICFGSVSTKPPEQIEELACALESSGYNFLWVLRGAFDEEFMEAFKVRTRGRGMVISWCCQTRVLRHPAVGGFVSHCGWNSIVEGVSCGVPMLGWPCIAEQKINSKILADVWDVLGARIVDVDPNGGFRVVGRAEIAQALSKIMSPEFAERAAVAAKEVVVPEPMMWLESIRKAIL